MLLGESEHEIGTGTTVLQRAVAPLVEELGPPAQVGIVLLPRGNRIRQVGLGAGEDRTPQPLHRLGLGNAGKHRFRPGGRGRSDHAPVDGEAGDQLEGRAIGPGPGLVGARQLVGVLAGQQGGIFPGDRQARGTASEGFGHAVEQPAGRHVEGVLRCMLVAGKGGLVIGVDGGDEAGPGPVGMLGDAPHQRHRVKRCGDHQLLALLQVETGPDGKPGVGIEEFFMCHGPNLHKAPTMSKSSASSHFRNLSLGWVHEFSRSAAAPP